MVVLFTFYGFYTWRTLAVWRRRWLPVSEAICHQVLNLPMHPYLPDDDARRIAAATRDALA